MMIFLAQVFLVGKDFGSRIAHHFTLHYEERVQTVVSVGVPFLPPGPASLPVDLLPKGFYILRWRVLKLLLISFSFMKNSD